MAIIEFINGKNDSLSALKRVLAYINNPAKTEEHLKGAHNCNNAKAYNDMYMVKNTSNKTQGRQYIHFTQSFAPYDKVTPEIIKKIADELIQHSSFNGYQVAYAVHRDREHLHTPFIVNTVHTETSKKWRQSKEELQAFKDYSDDLCRKYGLIITNGKKGNHINRGEYRTKDKGISWKYELFLAVKHCKWSAKSRDEFIQNMNKLGYSVNWTEERKYITFVNKEGKKCRNRKLYPPEQFTKEALQKAFDQNAQYSKEKAYETSFEILLSSIKLLQSYDHSETAKNFPISTLEGNNLKDKVAELKKGKGLDWDKDNGMEM
ncbi:MAG: relaxase/mobilization nuclease domain-containing protein [Vallitaleaceae bacterium]|jgi:hypothetical protein|nr:relaxase/mobilization nuclease domain-containing protein [Vallitaleaceae bacterium]